MKKIIILLLLIPIIICAHESISDMELQIQSKTGTEKVDLLNTLSTKVLHDYPQKSLDFAQQALDFAVQEGYKFGEGAALESIGNYYKKKLDNFRAIDFFKKARDAYLLAKAPTALAKILNYLGIAYESANDYTQALGYYKQSYDKYKELQDAFGMATLLTNIGSVYDTHGKYDKALEYYLRSLYRFENIGDKEGIASSLNNIGNIYQAMQNLDKALEYLNKAKEMYKNLEDSGGVAIAVHNIGIIYHDLGDYEKALQYYTESMKTDIERNDKMGIAASYNNIAIIYDETNNLTKSLDYYNRSLALSEEVNDEYSIANTNNNMGFLFLKMKKLDKAYKHLMIGLNIARRIGANELIKESYDGLAQYYRAKKDYVKCLEYKELTQAVRDSLFSINAQKKISEIENQYNLENKEREISLLQKENEIKLLQLNRQKNLRYLFIAILVFLVFIILLVYYAYNTKKKMTTGLLKEIEERYKVEEELKNSIKEKNVMLKEIHHRVKNNMQIISSLLNLQSRYITDKKSLAIFNDSQERIRSMALIHEKLYRSEDFTSIDFSEYIQDLTRNLLYSDYRDIETEVKVEDVALDINKAIPCGLVINELIMNAVKHAFSHDEEGKIEIVMKPYDSDSYILTIADDGIGMPEGLDFRNTKTLGLQLVTGLVRQLQGNIDVDVTTGTKFTIIFPK